MSTTRSSELFGLPRPFVAWSAGVAAVVGVVYALSPTLVWFTLAVVLLLKRAVKDLSGRERRWVLGLLVAALALRLMFVAGLFLHTDHYAQSSAAMFGDGRYAKDRSMWMRNVWLGEPIGPLYLYWMSDRDYGWTGYHFLLAYLQVFLGAMPYGIYLLNIGFALATAVMLYRLTRSAFGPAPAASALGAILFLPTLFVWSVSDLKDAFHVFLVATSLTALVAAWRTPGILGRIRAVTVLVAALAALQTVRNGALAPFILGAGGGLLVSAVIMRWRRLGVVLVCVALIGVLILWTPARAATLSRRAVAQAQFLLFTHIGNVQSVGHGYKLLEQQFYYYNTDACPYHICELTPGAFARYVIRAVAAFAVVPVPWQMTSASELAVLPQQGVWYGLFALALVGAPIALRRNALVAGLIGGYAVAAAVTISLSSGNVGTLVRLRDTVVPFILCFSAVGGCALVRRVASVGLRFADPHRGER